MKSETKRAWVDQVMGLPVSILARGAAAASEEAAKAAADIYAELREIDARFSTYRDDSEVSRITRGEFDLADAHPTVREVASRCAAARHLTDGLFDAVRPDGTWDPSGLVKGWAAARAARHLTAVPGLDWCLNAGGDVVVASASGRPFTVGIEDPRDATRICAAVPVVAGAAATSGTSARGAHIYDPRTGGIAAPHWASMTVTGRSLETADVLATAAYVAGASWLEVIACVPGYTALAVAPGGELIASPGWPGVPRD